MITQTEILNAIQESQKEGLENQRKAIHNSTAKIEDIQPYDNSAALRMIDTIHKVNERSNMKVRPINGYIIVKPSAIKETKLPSGIVVPVTTEETYAEGEIVEASKTTIVGDKEVEVEVKKGDKILYNAYNRNKIQINNIECVIMTVNEIVAIIEE
jgi:co-chaperonin GroES (HSP10)